LFPPDKHNAIRQALSNNLKSIVAQKLIKSIKPGAGRVPTNEIMIMNPTIENAIREGKNTQIYGAIEAGSKAGMINMDKSILRLVKNKLVLPAAALEKSHHPDELQAAMAALR